MENGDTLHRRACSVEQCEGGHLARGFCNKHYLRWKKYGNPLYTKLPRVSFARPDELRESLLSRRRIDANGCWVWTYSLDDVNGYGKVSIDAHSYSVHRVSAALFLGFDIHSPLQVLHRCDNPPCFNPEHLTPGAPYENSADMVKKGRSARGRDNARSKLTEPDVREIRLLLQTAEAQHLIARRFGVTQSTINKIHIGHTWNHVR